MDREEFNYWRFNPKAYVVNRIAKAVEILNDALRVMDHVVKFDHDTFRYTPELIKWFRRGTENIAAMGGLLLKELKWEEECREYDRQVGNFDPQRQFQPVKIRKVSNE
jgi:lipopolysaccharide biosynthesis protein